MKRTFAISLLILGLLIGAAGLLVLPSNPGRLLNAIEIVDPRPLADAAMPEGLKALGAMPVIVVELPPGPGPKRALLAPRLGKLLSSADSELGKIPEHGAGGKLPPVVAGANMDLKLGKATVKGVQVEVTATLHPLGPMFDDDLLMADTPEARAALGVPAGAGARTKALYLLPTESYQENRHIVSRLEADPSLLPTPDATVLTLARPPLLSDSLTRVLAIAFVCAGLAVLALQLRGVTRDELNHRFARK